MEDLELFQAQGSGAPLAHRVDRCRSQEGRRRLRERLASPTSDPVILRGWFDALEWMAREAHRFPPIPGKELDRLDRYLDDALATTGDRGLRVGRIEAFWISLREPDLVVLAEGGREALARVLAVALPLARRLSEPGGDKGHPVPATLRVLGESLLGLEVKLGLSTHLARAGSHPRLLGLDDMLRRKHRGDLKRLVSLVAELDLYRGAVELVGEGWAIPRLHPGTMREGAPDGGGDGSLHPADDGPFLRLDDAWHPQLPGAVRNGWAIGPGRNVHLVTGPNMAGKTTALRVLGISAWLAHCGLPVPAGGMEFRPLGGLHVGLHPRDDLARGVSLFLAEVLGVRTFLASAASGAPTLGIFDELFRGTNPADAREATGRVVRGLSRSRRGALVLSTHLTGLASEVASLPGVEARFLEGRREGDGFAFDFTLRDGVSEQRLGMQLFRGHGVEELLDRLE